MTNSQKLAEKIHDHLRKGGAVRFATGARVMIVKAKHIPLIEGSKREESINGVYVRSGKSRDYWMENYIRFSVMT
jgi:desulfoferrodoxin (superoxide reductase-like protein)